MLNKIRTSIFMLVLLAIFCSGIYTIIVTIVAKGLFAGKAEGSLITDKAGNIVASSLIGQNFTKDKYFWSRSSATSPMAYNASNSSGSNLGNANEALQAMVKTRTDSLVNANKILKDSNTAATNQPIPVDLVTASASGLDPNISLAAALYQAPRVAKARNISLEIVTQLVDKNTKPRLFGIFGEAVVNVVELNLALDNDIL